MIESARLLRDKFRFKGYIHLKVLPTMSRHLIFEMAEVANRLSLNLEAPNSERFSYLGSTKNFSSDLKKRLLWIDEAKRKGLLHSYTTQFVLGAAGETDLEMLKTIGKLYEETKLHRTYFSAFQPIEGTALEKQPAESELREYQFYQTDWLLRVYGFKQQEIESALHENEMFGNARDIKLQIACNNPEKFPVDVNYASQQELLHVPGIGPKGVEKICSFRENKKIIAKDFRQLGIIEKRALPFLTIEGQRQSKLADFRSC